MKITALDIHQKEFAHGMRGYRDDEVDDFLDLVAAEVDRLTKENDALRARLQESESKIAGMEGDRNAINNALLIAQRSADELTLEAEAEHDKTIKDAQQRADEIIHNTLEQKRELLNEIRRLKGEEERFRKSFDRLLEDSRRSISEVRLSDSVMAALADKEDSYAAAVARAESEARETQNQASANVWHVPEAPEPAPAVEPAPAPAPAVEGVVELTPAPEPSTVEVEAVEIEAVDKTEEIPVVEPEEPVFFIPEAEAPVPEPEPTPAPAPEPKKSHAEGLIIGEVGNDVPVDTTLIEPREFEIPGGNRWGDRDDDLDIEEID